MACRNLILLLLITIFLFSCPKEKCNLPDCRIRLGSGSAIVVTENVSGGQGTQITPDEIDQASITARSATVKFTVLRIGGCHKVLGHGHTWSSDNATPKIGIDNFVDYEDGVNFNDEIKTVLRNLQPNTRYWVRSWIAIEEKSCGRERIIFYNDKSLEFKTL